MSHLLREFELLEPLRARLADGMPAYGSCAGMILLASPRFSTPARPAARRCRWVDRYDRAPQRLRSAESTPSRSDLDFAGVDAPVHAVFIRAPWVERVGPEPVEVLATRRRPHRRGAAGQVLATAFHPEVTGDRRVHELFVDLLLSDFGVFPTAERRSAAETARVRLIASDLK